MADSNDDVTWRGAAFGLLTYTAVLAAGLSFVVAVTVFVATPYVLFLQWAPVVLSYALRWWPWRKRQSNPKDDRQALPWWTVVPGVALAFTFGLWLSHFVHSVVPGLPPRHSDAWLAPGIWITLFPMWVAFAVTSVVGSWYYDRKEGRA